MKLINLLSLMLFFLVPVRASARTDAGETRQNVAIDLPGSYTGLNVRGGVVVNYVAKNGLPSTKVTFTAPASIVSKLKLKIDDGELIISLRDYQGTYSGSSLTVNVTGRPVSRFDLSAGAIVNVNSALSNSGTFSVEAVSGAHLNLSKINCRILETDMSSGASLNIGSVTSTKFEVDNSSGSVVNAVLTTDSFSVDVSSGAIISLTGTAKSGEIDASSGAMVNCSPLKVEGTVKIDASSAAMVTVGRCGKVISDTSSAASVRIQK